jgi:hypothetical protein
MFVLDGFPLIHATLTNDAKTKLINYLIFTVAYKMCIDSQTNPLYLASECCLILPVVARHRLYSSEMGEEERELYYVR